jgi:hypothetical protein
MTPSATVSIWKTASTALPKAAHARGARPLFSSD